MNLEKEIISDMIDKIDQGLIDSVYVADINHELNNKEYFVIGRYSAESKLNKYGVFNAIYLIEEFNESIESTTHFSDPEEVLNTLVYILGDMIVNEAVNKLNFENDQILSGDQVTELKEYLTKKLNEDE